MMFIRIACGRLYHHHGRLMWVGGVLKTLGAVRLNSHHGAVGGVGLGGAEVFKDVGSREQHVCCRGHFMNIMVLINT